MATRTPAKAKSEKANRTTSKAKSPPRREAAEGKRSGGRALWSGSISFGLLQIPVGLHTAERREDEIHFRLLDKKDTTPVRYERVNAASGEVVEWKDIVKGYEIERDHFVVIEPEELARANVKATQTIDIQDFVSADAIDPAFFETPYFLVPSKRATKAYVLLREALASQGAVAVATFVLRTREHLAALLPVGDAIMLQTLRFGHELRDADDLPLPSDTPKSLSVSEREIKMAEQLIASMTTAWDPSKYKDRFHVDVMRIIEEKAKTGQVAAPEVEETGTVATNVVDLLDLLKQSVAAGKGAPANDEGTEARRPLRKGSKAAGKTRRKRTAA